MAIIEDWREKHSSRSGKGRLFLYIFLLIMILFLILKADTFVHGFTSIFFTSDSTSVQEEGPQE